MTLPLETLDPKVELALRDARISLKAWAIGTPLIDDILGPMSGEERAAAESARGGPLPDDDAPPRHPCSCP